MRGIVRPAMCGIASAAIAVGCLIGVSGGAGAEWQVPLCLLGLIGSVVATMVSAVLMLVAMARRIVRRR